MEATTQETTEGTTPEQGDSEVVQETATEPTEEAASYNLDDVPEKLRPSVEKKIREMELGFKRAYTQKTQSLSAEKQERDLELQTFKQKAGQYEAIINDIKANPSKISHYAALLTGQPQKDETPQFNTVGELTNYLENKISLNARIATEEKIREFQRVNRWDMALSKLKTDPVFKDFEDEIVMKVKTDSYSKRYNGENEHELLSAAFEDYKVKLRKQTDVVKQQTLSDLKQKKLATTATPKKTITTEGGPLTKEEIIAKVNARVH